MQKIGTVISVFLKKNNLEKGVKQNNALIIWDSVVGLEISKNTKPDRVELGVLTIKTTNATWRQELFFKNQEIIKKLNIKLGENTIKEIRYI